MKYFIFDFDSTIFPGESLDEIIELALKNKPDRHELIQKVKAICQQGMTGEITMTASLEQRLAIAAPDVHTINQYVIQQSDRIDSRIKQLLIALNRSPNCVFVVSGGFEEWIKPLLDQILPTVAIHANRMIDSSKPLMIDNIVRLDKEDIIRQLKSNELINSDEIIMIGDGATDFNVYANGIAQRFIGAFFYTGQSSRKKIVELSIKNEQVYFDELYDFLGYMNKYISTDK